MHRYQQSILISIIIAGLIVFAAACGVRETAERPGSGASTPTILAAKATISSYPAPDQSETFKEGTPSFVSEAQTSLVMRKTVEAEEYNDRLTVQARPTPNEATSTAMVQAFQVERTRIAQTPRATPRLLHATPLAGRGTLIASGQAPFPAIEFIGTNSWSYKVDAKSIAVYAGRQGHGAENDQDFNQGMVEVVDWTTQVPITVSSNKTPVSDGPARIEDAQVEGEQLYLTIVTEGGSRYRFHVNTGEFTAAP